MPDIVEKVYGYHIYFWSNEGEPLEPIHFHVSYRPHKDATKIWILSDGTLQIANNRDEIPLNVLNRIYMEVPILDFEGDFEEQKDNLNSALEAVVQIQNFIEETDYGRIELILEEGAKGNRASIIEFDVNSESEEDS